MSLDNWEEKLSERLRHRGDWDTYEGLSAENVEEDVLRKIRELREG